MSENIFSLLRKLKKKYPDKRISISVDYDLTIGDEIATYWLFMEEERVVEFTDLIKLNWYVNSKLSAPSDLTFENLMKKGGL